VLLDDDLAAIEGYVVGKNRLRNRFLHGDGVVCGLDVTCHPCGGGHVIVGSGYALDCCGNDIVVPCREELDIPAMIRQLRTATNGGYDCGPCVPTAQAAKGTGQTETRQVSASGSGEINETVQSTNAPDPQPVPSKSEPKGPQSRRYWLYVRYAEQLSDPVEPYATDAACSPAGCEASRVREGYQFFLRSHRCEPENDDIIARVLACVGSHKNLLHILDVSGSITNVLKSILVFLTSLSNSGQAVSAGDFQQPAMSRVMLYAADAADTPVANDASSSGQMIDDLSAAAATVLRAKESSEADRKAAGLTDAYISEASAALKTAVRRLTDRRVLNYIEDTARPFAEAILGTATRAADQQTGQPLAATGSPPTSFSELLRTVATELRDQKAWLLKMAERVGATDCCLAEEVATVRIPAVGRVPEEATEADPEYLESANQLRAAAKQLSKLTQRYLISCVCAALNPPCPNCTDDTVLLAGIDVLDCEVQSICQVVRRNVISGPGLRYWLALNRIPPLLEKVCCAEDACAPSGGGGTEPAQDEQPVETPLLGIATLGEASERTRVLIAVTQAMAGQDSRAARLVGRALNPAQVRTDLAKWAKGNPEVREVVGSVAAQEVKDAAAEQATQIAGQTARLTQLEATLQGRLGELDNQLAEIKQLRDELAQVSSPPASPTGPSGGTASPAAPAAPRAAAKKAPAKKAPAKKEAPRTTRKGPQ
jgi:hypothetical protein